jgi:hypothetical protein
MFSIVKRGSTLIVFIVSMVLMQVSSLQAQEIVVKPPQWSCFTTVLDTYEEASYRNPVATADHIVWEETHGNGVIYMQNRNTGAVTQIGNTESNKKPKIDGEYAVWQHKSSGSTWDIVRYNVATGKTKIYSTLGSDDKAPQIEGNFMIWEQVSGGFSSVGIRNITTGITTSIGSGSTNYVPYGISNGRILYLRTTAAGNSYVEVYTLATGFTTTLSTGLGIAQADSKENLAIRGDMVVWRNKTAGHLDDAWEIYAYNLATGTLTQITDDTYEDKYPAVDGTSVVYVRHVNAGIYQVRHHDLGSGISETLAQVGSAHHPTVVGSRVAWTGGGGITVYDLAENKSAYINTTSMTADGLFIHNNQLFFAGLMSGETSGIFRADCGYVSDEIELPVAGFTTLPAAEAKLDLLPLP